MSASSPVFRVAASAAALAILAAAPAAAQDEGGVRIRAGLGVQLQPEFLGDDSTELKPLVKFSMKRGEGPFSFGAPDDSFSFDLVDSGGFAFGPAARIEGSRKDSEVGAPVGKVKTTVEAGAFAQYWASDNLRLRAEVRKGLGGHDGWVGSAGIDQVWRDGDRYLLSVGPRVFLADKTYQRAWFGVSPAAALATGLPTYRPGGGLRGVGATASSHVQLGSGPWGLHGFARYERLVGNAADSPIIRAYGSRDQYSVGIALTHTFRLAL